MKHGNISPSNQSYPDTLYDRLLARLYDPIMKGVEARFLLRRRRELLAGIEGQVLEVGAGTGINFSFYPPDTSVLAIEPSAAMLARARRRLERAPAAAPIELMEAGLGDPALAQRLSLHSLDAVVITLVLCTLPDPRAALDRLRVWLRPGGRLYVLEHIASTHQPARIIEQAVTPVWKHLAGGCHLNRPTDRLLREAGFQPEWEKYYQKGMTFYQGVLRPVF